MLKPQYERTYKVFINVSNSIYCRQNRWRLPFAQMSPLTEKRMMTRQFKVMQLHLRLKIFCISRYVQYCLHGLTTRQMNNFENLNLRAHFSLYGWYLNCLKTIHFVKKKNSSLIKNQKDYKLWFWNTSVYDCREYKEIMMDRPVSIQMICLVHCVFFF